MRSSLVLAFLLLAIFTGRAQYMAEARSPTTNKDAYQHGEQAYRRGDHAEAVVYFTEAIALDPAHLNAYLNRAFCFVMLKQYADAIKDLTLVIEREPTHALAYTTRGSSYLRSGEPDKALADLEMVISLDPRNEEAWNNKGWAYKAKADMDSACKAWRSSQRMGNAEAKIILNNNRCK